MEQLPCGCNMSTTTDSNGDEVFMYEPCSMDCKYYQYVIEQANEQEKEVTTLDLRGDDG